MLKRKDKELVVKKIEDNLIKSKAVIISDFRGISVNKIKSLRKILNKNKVKYGVFKKSLINIAFKNQKITNSEILKDYKGPVSLAFSLEDEVSGAKLLANFKKSEEKLELIAGILENRMLNKEEVNALSKLPGKKELQGRLVFTINAPLNNFVGVLNGVLKSFIGVLKALETKKGELK